MIALHGTVSARGPPLGTPDCETGDFIDQRGPLQELFVYLTRIALVYLELYGARRHRQM